VFYSDLSLGKTAVDLQVVKNGRSITFRNIKNSAGNISDMAKTIVCHHSVKSRTFSKLNLKSSDYRVKSSFSNLTTGLKPPPVTSTRIGISTATELSTLLVTSL